MAAPSVTYTFTNGTTANATYVNTNFNDIINGITDGTKDLTINALTCSGTVLLNGAVTLGNAAADDITISGSLAASLAIKTDGSFNIGSAALGLSKVYFGDGGGNSVYITAPALTNNFLFTLPGFSMACPTADGVSGEILSTNGNGTLSFINLVSKSFKGMLDGIIVPSVAGNNLTVAIKDLSGATPSAASPVHVRIGDTVRTISSELYVTASGGTDLWNRTSYTYSLFVYLGWDAVNSRIEILLCSQPTYRIYPASNPAAPDCRRLHSAYGANAGTAITTNHALEVVGRIDDVVQSAADNYTGVTTTNVISCPIYETDWLNSPEVPTKTNGADTTPIFSTNVFNYKISRDIMYGRIHFNGDGGTDGAGTAGRVGLTLPFYIYVDLTSLDIRYPIGENIAASSEGGEECILALVSFEASPCDLCVFYNVIDDNAGATYYEYLTCAAYTNGVRKIAGIFTHRILV